MKLQDNSKLDLSIKTKNNEQLYMTLCLPPTKNYYIDIEVFDSHMRKIKEGELHCETLNIVLKNKIFDCARFMGIDVKDVRETKFLRFINKQEENGLNKNYYVTFGSDTGFPYPNKYLVLKAPSRADAQEMFRQFFPDRHENTLNYSFMYEEEEWKHIQARTETPMDCAGSMELLSNGLVTVQTSDIHTTQPFHSHSELNWQGRTFEDIINDINDKVVDLKKLADCAMGEDIAEEINDCLCELSEIYEKQYAEIATDIKTDKIKVSPDIQGFVDGKLVVHITTPTDYRNFICQIKKSGIKLSNEVDYREFGSYYDPRYPYFFMEDPESLYMNANADYENIVKHMPYCSAERCIEYSDLDFVKENSLQEENDYNEPDFE